MPELIYRILSFKNDDRNKSVINKRFECREIQEWDEMSSSNFALFGNYTSNY